MTVAHADYSGWAVGASADGYGTILHTWDNGTTWTRQGNALQLANADLGGVVAVDPLTAWVVGAAEGGYAGIYLTTNGGSTWMRQGSSLTLPDTSLRKVSAVGPLNVWAVGSGAVLHSSDGGATWTNLVPAGYEGTFLQGVFALNSSNVWVTGGTNGACATILHTTDGGQTWTRQDQGFVTNVNHILGVAAADANNVWAVGGLGNYALRSTNGGASWDMVDQGGKYDANELHIVNASNVWVAHDSEVRWTRDAGVTWEGFVTPQYTLGIAVAGDSNAWASVGNPIERKGDIYFTADGGVTWTQQFVAGFAIPELSTISFAVQPVPEPAIFAGLLAGALVWRLARRKAG